MATTLQRSSSAALFDKAQTLFPGGVNSPVRAFKSVGGTPLFVDKGQGAHIWDADGNEFIDFGCGIGVVLHTAHSRQYIWTYRYQRFHITTRIRTKAACRVIFAACLTLFGDTAFNST